MNLYSDRYFAALTYPKYNITFTDDESQELMAYSAMGYTPKEIARAMNRDEPEIILHGLYLGVLKVSRVEQKLPIQHLGTDCNPNDWNHFSSEPRTVDQIIRLEKLIQDKIWFVCHMAKRADAGFWDMNGISSICNSISWPSGAFRRVLFHYCNFLQRNEHYGKSN